MSETQTKAQRAQAALEHNNGGCNAVSQRTEDKRCPCESFEMAAFADGFSTCICGHTRNVHASTWVAPQTATQVAAG